jgi:DNA-binding CsgD family transcriptional regulator
MPSPSCLSEVLGDGFFFASVGPRLEKVGGRYLPSEGATAKKHRSLVAQNAKAQLFVRRERSYTDDSYVLLLELIRGKRGERTRRHGELTPRENEVLFWLQRGKSNVEIGVILGIAAATVGKHLERIYPKLGVDNRTAASHWHLQPHR